MLLAVALIAVLILSIYVLVEVPGMESQISSLQRENSDLQGQVGEIGNQVGDIASQLQSEQSSTQTTSSLNVEATACVSITADCSGFNRTGDVYLILLFDAGTTTFPAGYSVYLSFKDGTKLTSFGFNATLPSSLAPNGNVVLNATSWPQGTNATSKMDPGDGVGVAVLIGNYEAAAETHVLQCDTTTTSLNPTQTQTSSSDACG